MANAENSLTDDFKISIQKGKKVFMVIRFDMFAGELDAKIKMGGNAAGKILCSRKSWSQCVDIIFQDAKKFICQGRNRAEYNIQTKTVTHKFLSIEKNYSVK